MKNKMKKYLKDPKNAVILSVKGVNPKQLKKMADHYESVDLPGTETEPQQKASAKPVKGVRHQDTIKEAHRSDFVPAGSPAKEYLEGIEEMKAYHKKGEKNPRRWMDLIRNLEGVLAAGASAGAGVKARRKIKSRIKNMRDTTASKVNYRTPKDLVARKAYIQTLPAELRDYILTTTGEKPPSKPALLPKGSNQRSPSSAPKRQPKDLSIPDKKGTSLGMTTAQERNARAIRATAADKAYDKLHEAGEGGASRIRHAAQKAQESVSFPDYKQTIANRLLSKLGLAEKTLTVREENPKADMPASKENKKIQSNTIIQHPDKKVRSQLRALEIRLEKAVKLYNKHKDNKDAPLMKKTFDLYTKLSEEMYELMGTGGDDN